MSLIFCVEDDGSIRDLVCYTLEKSGFEAQGFHDGAAFFHALEEGNIPDLLLLDIMLPGMDGNKILKKLRSDIHYKNLPVIMLTAKVTEYDKVTALDMGADDYVTKPFGMMELLSRIRAVLRRYEKTETDEGEYHCGKIVLKDAKREVSVGGKDVNLTYKEYELLKIMMQHPEIVFSRDQLLNAVWGFDYDGESRTLDVHIGTLRQKLGKEGSRIETVRGVGYRLREAV